MNGAFRAALGYERIRFFSESPERILNFILQYNIPVWDIEKGDGSISFCVSLGRRRYFRDFEKKLRGNEKIEREKKGSLWLFQRFGKRFGLFFGVLFFFASLAISTSYVWSVQVEGNEIYRENEIRDRLKEIGVAPGVRIKSIDTAEAALLFQVKNPEFSFLSVNLIGTVARVELRERESVEKTKTEETFSNQVAKIAGRIVRFEVLSGEIQVKIGESVPQGTLLISGVRENKSGGFTAVQAKGRVFAETYRRFEETILFEQKKTVYTGREEVYNSYQILGALIGGNGDPIAPFSQFELLETREDVTLFGKELPIVRTAKIFVETEEKNEVVTVDRARILAYDKYEQYKRDIFASDDKILEENVTFSESETGVTITVELVAVENICKEQPFFCNDSYRID